MIVDEGEEESVEAVVVELDLCRTALVTWVFVADDDDDDADDDEDADAADEN